MLLLRFSRRRTFYMMSLITRFYRGLGRLFILVLKMGRRACMFAVKPMFKHCGRNVIFNPFDSFTYSSIKIGNDVFIGKGAVFLASKSTITIGDKVMFGPQVTIMGGDHNTSEIGCFMIDIKQKRTCDDLPVVIENDVWIGTGAIILKGVTIGRGSIVAAGSVVTHSIPEFSIAAGIPARVIKPRFSHEQLQMHKHILGLRN